MASSRIFDQNLLSSEFVELNNDISYDDNFQCNAALSFLNVYKNRYPNVLPLDHSRVVLSGPEGADYINANYIRGFQNNKAYIATQAPIRDTFADFWRLIYEQQVHLIVMLTKLTENGKAKADVYWPSKPNESSFFGNILVTFSQEISYTQDITLRYFTLKHRDFLQIERKVVQIHYTGFPDFGRPQNKESFIRLIGFMEAYLHWADNRIPSSSQRTSTSTSSSSTSSSSCYANRPIVLHCSAGIGRTGTLIACHVAWRALKSGVTNINIKKLVKELREDRKGMVQSVEQYVFVHEVVEQLMKVVLNIGEENDDEDGEGDEMEEESLDGEVGGWEGGEEVGMEYDEDCNGSMEDLGWNRSIAVRN